jgi:hypothetical protein
MGQRCQGSGQVVTALFLKLFGIAFVYHSIRFLDNGRFEIESKSLPAASNFRVIQVLRETDTYCPQPPVRGRIYYHF